MGDAHKGRAALRAVCFHEHGGPEVLRLEDVPVPEPEPDEVVVAVGATSLNYADIFTRRGMPGVRTPLPMIGGIDAVGTIERLSSEASAAGWREGDLVSVYPLHPRKGLMGESYHGGLGERIVCTARQLLPVPDGLEATVVSALPAAYATAHRMLVTRGELAEGETVLVLGASGGVGTACVQLAKRAGCTVVACASSEAKLDALRLLGADHGVDSSRQDLVEAVHGLFGKPRVFDRATGLPSYTNPGASGGVDVVVNFTGGDTWLPSLKCLRMGGRLLTCGATAGFGVQEDLRYVFSFELTIRGSTGWTVEDQRAVIDLAAAGTMRPPIDIVLPLEEYGEAYRRLEERRALGKIVLVHGSAGPNTIGGRRS